LRISSSPTAAGNMEEAASVYLKDVLGEWPISVVNTALLTEVELIAALRDAFGKHGMMRRVAVVVMVGGSSVQLTGVVLVTSLALMLRISSSLIAAGVMGEVASVYLKDVLSEWPVRAANIALHTEVELVAASRGAA